MSNLVTARLKINKGKHAGRNVTDISNHDLYILFTQDFSQPSNVLVEVDAELCRRKYKKSGVETSKSRNKRV